MRPAVVVLASLLLVGAAAASAVSPTRSLAQAVAPSIVYGKNSTRVGWYVSLGKLDKDGKWVSFCGGMLITQTMVLTAAHCMLDPQGVLNPPETVAIGIHSPATDKPDVDYDLASVLSSVVHPRFLIPFFRLGYDIALLQLDPKTVTGRNELVALPTYVPKPRNPLKEYTRLQAVGLGDVVGNRTRPAVLQSTELVLEPLEACDAAWPTSAVRPSFFQSTNICAGGPPDNKFTDTCAGDSGGPLFAPKTAGRPYDTAIGLVSYGINCKLLYDKLLYGKPGVYTNIAQLRKWVDANIGCYARSKLCPWGGTCFDNPANGCATCEPGLPPPGQQGATSPWKCATCTVPGYVVDPEQGQCRPKDCRDVVEDCVACDRRRTLACAACNPPMKLASGKCVLRTCLDYDRGCQQCDPASPLTCTACKRGRVQDPATGKCLGVR